MGKKIDSDEDFIIRVGRVPMRSIPVNVCNPTCFTKLVSVFMRFQIANSQNTKGCGDEEEIIINVCIKVIKR